MLQDPSLHYLDNAATTLVAPEVADAIRAAMAEHWANPSALYAPGAASEAALSAARAVLAKTLGCTPAEVVFTGCGSEGNNLALLGLAAARKGWGKKIVASGYEHPSVARPLERLAREGWQVELVPPEKDGRLPLEELLNRVDKTTALVACMQVNNETGAQNDVAALAAGVKAENSRTAVHVDGVQGWLRLPALQKETLCCIDTYTVSGHKIHAPKGVGALYLRRGCHILPPYLGGGQERDIRPGTENTPYAVGIAAAASRLFGSIPARQKAAAALNAQLRKGLAALPGAVINSPDDAIPQLLNFSLEGGPRSETMLHYLETKKVYVSSGSACSKGAASHTLTAMGLPAERIDTALRVSFCADNTPEDVNALLEGLEAGLKTLQTGRGRP